MARKVFGHGSDVCLAVRGDEGPRERAHGLGISTEASLAPCDDRVPRIDAEIDHWSEIDVDPCRGELLRHCLVALACGAERAGFRFECHASCRGIARIAR